MAVYKFEDSFFWGMTHYGSCSGCDPWMDADPKDQKELFDEYLSELTEVKNIWEIQFDKYTHPDLRNTWETFIESEGHLNEYRAHSA